jgi:CubicO group peptidase (beta-lactamase class C family)
MDLSLGFPTRFGYGLMLGAQLVSLFGRDTQRAFGHLGFTNTLGWADPQRGTSVGIVTSGKPTVYPEVWRFLGLSQRITGETTP